MSRIEDQANYYKNLPLRYRNLIGVVHIENEDDKRFWAVQLQKSKPGDYHFVTQSKSERGLDSKGCEQCLKYVPYLNQRFFICIDTDLRLLCGESGLEAANFIAQTYTYSWENHACEATHLDTRFRAKVPDVTFSFERFLRNLSGIAYKPLLYLIYHHNDPRLCGRWNVSTFNKCIPLQMKRSELADSGEPYLQKINQIFDKELECLSIPAGFAIDGLTPENAYLHIQGHRLYDLIMHIGTLLCKGKRVAFKSEVLDAGFPVSGYCEIDSVRSDLSQILKS